MIALSVMTTYDHPVGIPTMYGDTQYRSRLEARWAAFFDRIDWHYTYEPFDTEGYIPDFLVQLPEGPMIVEVKPAVTWHDYHDALCEVVDRECGDGRLGWKYPVLILGVEPYFQTPALEGIAPSYTTAGLGTHPGLSCLQIAGTMTGGLRVPNAIWWIGKGGGITLRASYTRKGFVRGEQALCDGLDRVWRKAGNDVQWKSPRDRA